MSSAVVDVDIRWAGEPDVVLHLTKLGGASLGLSEVQLAGVIRFVFSPITEDPPFLRRMSISLLDKPYVDFSVRALGGPDLMALPAISSWLRAAVITLAERRIVFPKEVSIAWARVGPHDQDDIHAMDSALAPPLGVLVVRIVSADIEPRRSTFLGRLKLPSPRIALLLPDDHTETGRSALQVGITEPRDKTLTPQWERQFLFVVVRPDQRLCMLLSHKRMDLLGADMPLGMIQIPLEEVIEDARLDLHADNVPSDAFLHASDVEQDDSYLSARSTPRNSDTETIGSFSNARGSMGAPDMAWASPSTSSVHVPLSMESRSPSMVHTRGIDWGSVGHSVLRTPESLKPGLPTVSPQRAASERNLADVIAQAADEAIQKKDSLKDQSRAQRALTMDVCSTNGSLSSPPLAMYETPEGMENLGLGLVIHDANEHSTMVSHWNPPGHGSYSDSDLKNAKSSKRQRRGGRSSTAGVDSNGRERIYRYHSAHSEIGCSNDRTVGNLDDAETKALDGDRSTHTDARAQGWLAVQGVTVELVASGAVTMAGMVSQALQQQDEALGKMESDEKRGWFSSLQSFVLGATEYEEDYVEDHGDVQGNASTESAVGRVQMHLQWLPVFSSVMKTSNQLDEIDSIDHDDALASSQTNTARSSLDATGKLGRSAASRSQGGEPEREKDDKKMRHKNERTKRNAHKQQHRSSSWPMTSSSPPPELNVAGLSPTPSSDLSTGLVPSNEGSPPSSLPAILPQLKLGSESAIDSGILAIYVSYTKLDYGDVPNNPVLALSVGSIPPMIAGAASAAVDALLAPRHRVMCMESESGGRPGLLHWNRVFHLVVWDAVGSRVRLELGDVASSLKLSSYGAHLYTLDACQSFETSVNVDATATVPLKDVKSRGLVRGTWRLREARGGGRGAVNRDQERLDVGRVALVMAWHPFAA